MATSRAEGSPYPKLPFDADKLEAAVPGFARLPFNTLYQVSLPDGSVIEIVRVPPWPDSPGKDAQPASRE